jgi:hypothetical protein
MKCLKKMSQCKYFSCKSSAESEKNFYQAPFAFKIVSKLIESPVVKTLGHSVWFMVYVV